MLSVLNQTFLDLEYIVIDGDSKDHTLDKIQKLSKNIFIEMLS